MKYFALKCCGNEPTIKRGIDFSRNLDIVEITCPKCGNTVKDYVATNKQEAEVFVRWNKSIAKLEGAQE